MAECRLTPANVDGCIQNLAVGHAHQFPLRLLDRYPRSTLRQEQE
jgi:hypothetical protein